ncbi:MAG: site-specific integrase, partial [Nocardioidaceae bacterium]|nr:site-specific integrase [Nocardioidaceae bacterium]
MVGGCPGRHRSRCARTDRAARRLVTACVPAHGAHVARSTHPEPLRGGVPGERWTDVLAAYERHLVAERSLAAHTVRAYLTDLRTLAEHASRMGVDAPQQLDLRTLRSYLAAQQARGRARTTLARRAATARVFTRWLATTGRAGSDSGAMLASPKQHRTLPATLRADEVRSLLDAAVADAQDHPEGLRDAAVLELLYAT